TGERGIIRYVAGLGKDDKQHERIVMECSSGLKLRQAHAEDDTIKQIHSLMCIHHGIMTRYPNASCKTLARVKIYGIQSIK
ncbi:uncharacterized protein BYT42DRAFT_476517, partial [Radiomyces spectabilis]|uniref:uncharacterized protein n=1 Tax=Radiomyces spectabilis TaxID=64574 RepID=UPI00221E4D65